MIKLIALLLICLPLTMLAQEPVTVIYLPDTVRQIATTNATLRIELRQGLTRLWGMDTNDTVKQAWADMGWTQCLNGTQTGWVYVVTHRQTEDRVNLNFAAWRTRLQTLGGNLWRNLTIWTDSGLVPVETP